MRAIFVWLHRYVGLAMAAFLIIEGVTGSLIAFRSDLSALLDPRFLASPPSPGAERLDLATLAERAEALAPKAQVAYFMNRDDQAVLRVLPRDDPAIGKPYDIDFGVIVLDPWTGKELTRVPFNRYTDGFVHDIMPFVYDLHTSLALGEGGAWVLAILAIVWTIDCFVGFYLTLPVSLAGFWRRWKPAWLIKPKAGFFRLNFDLHRASGLWLWPMLFVFAWSSVTLLDKTGAYDWTMSKLFDYPFEQFMMTLFPPREDEGPPKLDWRAAQAAGERLMAEQAARQGFKIEKPVALNHLIGEGLYNYTVLTDRSFPGRKIGDRIFRRRHRRLSRRASCQHRPFRSDDHQLAAGAAYDPGPRGLSRLPRFRMRHRSRHRDAFGHWRLHLVEEAPRAKIGCGP